MVLDSDSRHQAQFEMEVDGHRDTAASTASFVPNEHVRLFSYFYDSL